VVVWIAAGPWRRLKVAYFVRLILPSFAVENRCCGDSEQISLARDGKSVIFGVETLANK
jgi:hypothetical protein